jgi:hypothetical protein
VGLATAEEATKATAAMDKRLKSMKGGEMMGESRREERREGEVGMWWMRYI